MTPKEELDAIVARLDPHLSPHGFRFEHDANAVSSGGRFANGSYVRGTIGIGLIVRSGALGEIVYKDRGAFISHGQLMAALGHGEDCRLSYNQWRFTAVARDQGDPLDALVHDLETHAPDFLAGNLSRFHAALQQVDEDLQRRSQAGGGGWRMILPWAPVAVVVALLVCWRCFFR